MINKILFFLGLLPAPVMAQVSFSQYMVNIGSNEEPDKVIVRIKTERSQHTIFIYSPEGSCLEYKVDDVMDSPSGEQIFICGKTYFTLSVEDRIYIKTPFSGKVPASPITVDGVDIERFGETDAFLYLPYRLISNQKQYIF